jgi:glycosyltransferase involved in cell wall biosynthesis
MGGAVTYLKNVLSWLPEVAPENDFIVCLPESTRREIADEIAGGGVQFVDYPYANTNGLARLFYDQVDIPRRIIRQGIDVLFSSTGFGTFYSPCPEVLLVRNPVYFNRTYQAKYREQERDLTRIIARRWYSLFSVRQADRVLFPTRAMQDMVESFITLDRASTRALHYGFDRDRFRAGSGSSPPWLATLRKVKKEGHPLLLNVSTYAVHKNFETLVEALPHLRARGHDVRLVTTTSRDRTSDTEEYDALKRKAEQLGVSDMWIELGYVPYHDLRDLYACADVYVFPSFTESFGHTMVEAMASGLPTVAAGEAVNREVCDEAGIYFSTFDAEQCAHAVADVLSDRTVRNALVQHAEKRASRFSWRDYTRELVDIFHDMAAQA